MSHNRTVKSSPVSPALPGTGDDLDAIADAEIPEVQREAQDWLIANNASDQRAITVFAVALGVPCAIFGVWWAVVLAGCILLVLPFRWAADPYFRSGDVQRGLLLSNLGTWYLVFPLVFILPNALPIAIQNVIGPLVLAAAYLERRVVRRLIPVAVAVAIGVSVIGFTTDGVGLEERIPDTIYYPVLIAYLVANLLLVVTDIRESNQQRLRVLRRAVTGNRELQATDQALRDSRRRLLVAADEERIRLEQNLHDGAQQRLVSLAMQLRLAAELVEEGTPASATQLMSLHGQATEAVEELRHLAQGLYPARLTELGLARALHAVARRSPRRIIIEDTTTGELDEACEVALYFVCLEAIQNATKHGDDQTTIVIALAEDDDGLWVTISDDGPGFHTAVTVDSRGLQNMADRVNALGGELQVDSAIGTGTTVTALLPHDAADRRPVGVGA